MPEGAWIHYGLTSSDVVDTALCSSLAQAMDIVIAETLALARRARRDARSHRSTCRSWDARTACSPNRRPSVRSSRCFAFQVQRDVERARTRATAIAVGKLSGAVGTYSNIDPAVEAYVCSRSDSRAVPATQVIARDRHAEVLYACASPRHDDRAVRARGAPPRAQRSRRGRRAVRRGPEGLVVDAAQAQSRPRRAALRARAGAARLLAGRSRRRRALARARHLALQRRARRAARRVAAHGVHVA